MDISYKGTHFHGWQVQTNAKTIQAEIEKGLSLLLKQPISVIGSGRTDAGVHATQQMVHFDVEGPLATDDLMYKLNSFLSLEISINKIGEVKPEAHARFDATARTYHYHIHQRKSPFKNESSYYFTPALDVPLINRGCEIIGNWQNFECFSKVHTEVNHFNCEIFDIHWHQNGISHLFLVRANRFLRGMVRAMVGTLLDVGVEKMSLEELAAVLESGDRSKAGRAVPAKGLFLEKVEYPETIGHL